MLVYNAIEEGMYKIEHLFSIYISHTSRIPFAKSALVSILLLIGIISVVLFNPRAIPIRFGFSIVSAISHSRSLSIVPSIRNKKKYSVPTALLQNDDRFYKKIHEFIFKNGHQFSLVFEIKGKDHEQKNLQKKINKFKLHFQKRQPNCSKYI